MNIEQFDLFAVTDPKTVQMAGWREDERLRRAQVDAGQSVVANVRNDPRLIAWAKAEGVAVYIGHSKSYGPCGFGNPFHIGHDGGRDEVCDLFADYLPKRPDLMARLGELKGKVLMCHCVPLRCHGDHLAELTNSQP